jgi:uncharacterized membrane protein YebE (DUF533 family)
MGTSVTDSEFYMWRTLVATAHADNKLTGEEIRFLAEVLEDVPFSKEQNAALVADIKNPKDVAEMFKRISDAKDQARFFRIARELVWADGDFGKAEQDILLKLKKAHIENVDVDALVGKTDLELDESSED